MNRRDLIKIMGSAAMSLGMPKLSWAAAKPNSLYKNAIVIDGNLAGPWDDEKPFDAATAAELRASGLTAFKQTLVPAI